MEVAPAATRPAARVYDAATLDRCRQGEPQALERVLAAEAPAVERLLGRILGPRAPLEDLLQDVLEATIRAFGSFRGEAAVSTWMARIAVRTAYHYLRQPDARRRTALELVGEPPSATPPVEQVVAARRALDATYKHLQALSPRKRIAFILHVFEGRPIAEVAALMSATRPATKSRVLFARRELLARARRDPELRELMRVLGSEGEQP
jgi:RNA polymerase sigma-70 factor (ECF subfamily)